MKNYNFLSIFVLLFLLIVFSIGSYYLAMGFKDNISSSKKEVLRERLKQYIQENFNVKSWNLKEIIPSDSLSKLSVSQINERCTQQCKNFLKNTEYNPVDSFVIFENENICYCIYS
ncbi:MAG: hypothetical protein QXR30_02185 [Candidatus Woesearchaeota archaeon]